MRLFDPEAMGADVAAEEPFGPYLVYERLGVGGMATVHRALERGIEGFERIVALKRLLPHLAADATFIKSFVREAKLASLLNHVNIVQIHELGRVGTQYFISMEYIDGRDIRRILRHARKVSGPPPIHVTVGLLLQLCEALDYAHHKVDDSGHPLGLVHRDVSPSNVLVTSAGQVKVIDFGIAKAQSAQLRTQTGRVKGKLAYMAPEALAGKDLDARSDLFAAGVIAHELVTARPLFASKNEYQTLMKVQRGEVMPPSTFNQGCPPELDAIVLRALARDPDDRFLHAGELRDELHAMRKQYNLQTADRDIASWLEWAFHLEAPGGGAADPGPGPEPDPRARHKPRTARPRRHDDDEAVELAWGGHEDPGDGEPIVLDDVPDVSAKHLQHASALGAEVRLDVDDLDDDIPTPPPSHARPTVDLAARTVTTPLLPRHAARRKASAQVRTGPSIASPRAGDGPPAAAAPPDGPAPAGDDGATQLEISPIAPAVRSALVPARSRTLTSPPRPLPAASIAPRSAAAALPPRIVPAGTEPSRGVPAPAMGARSGAIAAESSRGVPIPAAPSRSGAIAAAPSRSGAVAAERSRSVPIPAAPSRSGAIAAEPSRGSSPVELSQGIPVTIEPSYVGPAPLDAVAPAAAARPGLGSMTPSRPGPAAIPPPRVVPSSSVSPPRRRRPTSPGTGSAPGTGSSQGTGNPLQEDIITPLEPVITGRDTLLDLSPRPSMPSLGHSSALSSTESSAEPSTESSAEPSTESSAEPSTEPSTEPSAEPSAEPSTDRAPRFGTEDLGLAADTMPAMPAMSATQTSVSVVRFREPTVPPAISAPAAVAPSPAAAASPPASAGSPPAGAALPPTAAAAPPSPTELVPALRDTPPHVTMLTSTRRQRLITPATALFAEPDADPSASAAIPTSSSGFTRLSHTTLPDVPPAAPRRASLARVVLVLVCLALVSAATTAAALYLTRDDDTGEAPRPKSSPAPGIARGTVHVEVVPEDAAIAITGSPIAGKLMHHGSPWSPELEPGGYQIEIDRDGYMGWLTSIDVVAGQSQTLKVPLEALGSALIAEATLVIGSSPSGLDVTVDGVGFGKTPGKLTITAGHHTIALRRGDAEVWRREIDARTRAIYEFHPTVAPPPAPPPGAAAPAPPEPHAPAADSPAAPAGEPAAGATGSAAPAAASGEATPPAAPAPAPALAAPTAPPAAAPPAK